MTESQILELLEKRFSYNPGNGPRYVFCPGVRDNAGFDAKRTADLIVMECWASDGLRLLGFEIKTSRSDWLRELKQPDKAAPFVAICDTWTIVAPEGAVKREELPKDVGLLEVRGDRLHLVKESGVSLHPASPFMGHLPRGMLASLLRSATTWAVNRVKYGTSAAIVQTVQSDHDTQSTTNSLDNKPLMR